MGKYNICVSIDGPDLDSWRGLKKVHFLYALKTYFYVYFILRAKL